MERIELAFPKYGRRRPAVLQNLIRWRSAGPVPSVWAMVSGVRPLGGYTSAPAGTRFGCGGSSLTVDIALRI
jgi:hypothetical protein